MSNPVITIDLEVNGEKALKSISDFKKDASEKLSAVNDSQNLLDSVLPQLKLDEALAGSGSAISTFAESMTAASKAVLTMQQTLKSFSTSMNLGRLSDGMTHMFEGAYRTMLSSIKNYNKEVENVQNKRLKSDRNYNEAEQNVRLSTATGLSASEDMRRMLRIVNSAKRQTGLDSNQIGELMPALYSIVRNKTDEYRRQTRSTPKLDELANYIADQEIFKNTATSSISGYNPTQKQLAQLAKGAIIATRSGSYRDNLAILKAAGLKGTEHQYVTDQLPEVFRKAYINYGKPSAQNTPTLDINAGKASADEAVYRKFMNLVKNGNQQAIRIGQDVGLLRAKNGKYQFSGNANMAQFNTMAGLAAQVVGDAKSSLPYHYIWRNDQTQQRKLLNRQNNVFNDALELMEVLSGQKGLTPDAYGYSPYGILRDQIKNSNKDLFGFVGAGEKFKEYNKKQQKIQTLGVANQYVVPKTRLDASGKLIWRDPNWQKEEVQEKKDDFFATVGNSALTYLLGMHGNNTYGYGRDSEGKAIYETPKILRIGTSHLYTQIKDKNGTRMIVDPTKKEEADKINRLFARQETLHYAKPGEKETTDNEYIAAFGDAESLTMIRKSDYDNIVKRFTDLGMANPFNNMNTGGLFESGNYKNAAKMIDVGKKKATPGFRYADLGYQKQPRAALVDFEQLYDYLGVSDADPLMRRSERLDGVAIFDPRVLAVNAQMRSGVVGKFMGQATDWRKLLYESGLLESAYKESRKDDNVAGNRGLITRNDKNAISGHPQGYSFYMPQIGLSKEESEKYINEVNTLQHKIDKAGINAEQTDIDELNRIRSTYFYDIMDKKYDALITDSTIKNNDKFRIISKDAFTNKNGIFRGEKWVKDRGDGTVELSADQQRRYFERATRESGGYWINRTGYDFRTDKNFIPESLASAMGLGAETLKEQSNANYDEYISKMETDQNARINFLKSTPYGRRLVQEGLYNSDAAERLIRAHISDFQTKQAEGHLFLPEYGIDNLLTGVMPGSLFGNIFERAFGAKVEDNNTYRQLFTYGQDDNRVFMKTLQGKQDDIVRQNAIAAKLMLSRMPAGPGEYGIGVQNLGDVKAIQKALNMLGADYSDTIYTDPGLQYKLMTGDYDGDTAWVIRGLNNNQFEKMQAVQDYIQNARQKILEQMEGAAPEEKKKLENDLDAFTNFGADHFTAQIGMGQATAAIRNSLADLSDDDPDKWIAIAEAIDAYDKNTSEAMKEGKIVKLGSHASREAMEGALFRRFVKQVSAYGAGAEDVQPDIFATRLPEIRDTSTLFDLVSNFKGKRQGKDIGKKFSSDLDSWLFDQYGYSNSYEAQAARSYGDMFKNVESGNRLVNAKDIANARLIAVKWGNELERDRKAGRAGEEFEEEERRQRQFVRRLKQVEESGSLQEDFLDEINRMQNERDRLIRSGVSVDDKQIVGLDKKIGLYETLTADMSAPFQNAQREWDIQKQKMDEDVKARYEQNLALAKTGNINMKAGVEAMLGPALSTDMVTASKINFSDVSPWLYDLLTKKKGFSISGVQGFAFNDKGEVIKDANILDNIAFNPYPYDPEGIRKQKGEILAREMDTKHEWIQPYTDTVKTVMGTFRHEAFEQAMLAYAKGEYNKDGQTDIAKIYEGLLTSANQSTDSKFRQLGLSLERDEETGKYKIVGGDLSDSENLNAALGTWNEKTKTYEGGSLSQLMNYVIKNGYQVANVEGFNINDKGQKMNAKEIDPDDYSGRGTRFETTIKDKNGNEITKVGTFAPDLILKNKQTGMYSMLDYKSGREGALDSIYQMMIYAKDIEDKAQRFVSKGQTDRLKELGWDQYVDDKGKLNFSHFMGYDTSRGRGYSYKYNEDVAQAVYDDYKEAILNKTFASDEEKLSAQRRLVSEVAKKYGISPEYVQNKTTEEAVRTLTKNDSRGEWYSNYLAEKFNKDEETLNEILSTGYAAKRKYGDREVGGYSKFAASRRMLEESVDPDVIDKLISQAEETGDTGSIKTLLEYKQRVSNARNVLNEGELLAAKNAFKDVNSYIQEQFFGVKESKPLSAFNAVRKKILDAESIRAGLMENPEAYNPNAKGEKWLKEEYKKAYEESGEDMASTYEYFQSLLPDLATRSIKQNNKQLEKLLEQDKGQTPEEAVEKYYQDRYDALQQYVEQQKHDLDEYVKKLEQKDDRGHHVLKHGSEERKIFEELRDNSRDNLQKALDALESPEQLQKAAQREYERSIGLVHGEKAKTRSDKQKEYLDKIKADYEVAINDNKYMPLYTELHNAELADDTEKYNSIKSQIDKMYKSDKNAKEKMKEFSALSQEYQMQKELDDIQKEITQSDIDKMYSGGKQSKDNAINYSYLRMKQQAMRYAETLSEDERQAFWSTHQDSDLRARAEQEYAQKEALQAFQREEQQVKLDQFMRQRTRMNARMLGVGRNPISRGLQLRDQMINAYENRKLQADQMIIGKRQELSQLEREGKTNTDEYKQAASDLQKLEKESSSAANNINQLGGAFGAAGTVMASFGQSLSNIFNMFKRRIFMSAINEAKRFVKEFNQTMTTIQMITLKTDSQMSTLGSGLIEKAQELKVSIGEVSTTAATLYRQGLSDEEVNERLDVISKFSKVSGTKVEDATKLITIAMNTGLVSDPRVAGDIVTALGDNAATNAAQIEKGIEKAGAAAAADGTTFAELAAMLTAITSTTQIGGNVAGRTLNTIFGRMNKIGTNELIYDENGNAVSGSAIARLLKEQGVETYDQSGNKRSSFDVLYDLSQKWESLSDAKQQQLANAIAGTRQYSNFAAIMQGMTEGKVDEYLKLTENSEGIVDEKNEIRLKSLQATIDSVKNAWDAMINKMVDTGQLNSAADALIGIINGLGQIVGWLSEMKALAPTILALMGAFKGAQLGASIGGAYGALAGSVLGLIGGGVTGAYLQSFSSGTSSTKTEKESAKELLESNYSRYESTKSDINKFRLLSQKNIASKAEQEQYDELFTNLSLYANISSSASDAASSIDDATSSFNDVARASSEAAKNSKEYADQLAKEAEDKANKEYVEGIYESIGDAASEIVKESGEEFSKDVQKKNGLNYLRQQINYSVSGEADGFYVPYSNESGLKFNVVSMRAEALKGVRGDKVIEKNQEYLAKYFADVSSQYYNLPKEFQNISEAKWLEYLKEFGDRNTHNKSFLATTKVDGKDFFQYAYDYGMENYTENMSSFPYIEKQLKNYLKEIGIDNTIVPYLAEQIVSDYKNDQSIQDFYNENGVYPTVDRSVLFKYLGQALGYNINPDADIDIMNEAINTTLNRNVRYRTSGIASLANHGLDTVGASGYYLDETGKKWTQEETESYLRNNDLQRYQRYYDYAQQASNERRAQMSEKAAKQLYYRTIRDEDSRQLYLEDKAIEKYGFDIRPLKESSPDVYQRYIDFIKDDIKSGKITAYNDLSEEQKDYYTNRGIQTKGNWDELTQSEKDNWAKIALGAAGFEGLPELDTSMLTNGVIETEEELQQFIEANADVFDSVVDDIKDANKEAENSAHKFTAVKNNFVDFLNYSNGQDAWYEKNQLGIASDTIAGIIMSQGFYNDVSGLNQLMDYINGNPTLSYAWQTIGQQSQNVNRILHQANYDRLSGQWTAAPDDIMSQLLFAIQSEGLSYKGIQRTTKEKGTIASNGYQGLFNGEYLSQQQLEDAQNIAWVEYQNRENALQEELKNTAEFFELSSKNLGINKIISGIKEKPLKTREEYLASIGLNNVKAMSPEEQQYLQEILGADLYRKVLESHESGIELKPEDQKIIQTKLNNAVLGMTSLTSAQKLEGINEIYALSQRRNGLVEYSQEVAKEYLSGWENADEYLALARQSTLTASEQNRLEVLQKSLENFQRNSQISFEVEGVSALEQANEVLEGTTNLIESLKKGGEVEIKAKLSFENEMYNTQQQAAALANGTRSEQIEAIMALTGRSKAQVQNDFEGSKAAAESILNTQKLLTDESLNQIAKVNPELAANLAQAYGFKQTNENWLPPEEAIKALNNYFGYGENAAGAYKYDSETGELYYNVGSTRMRASQAAQDKFNQYTQTTYTPDENYTPNQNKENTLYGAQRTYTDVEKSRALEDILAGRMTFSNENADLYNAAVSSAGVYTQELLRRQANDEKVDEWLNIASENERAAAKTQQVTGFSTQLIQAQKAQYALDNYNYENASDIASALGMNEEDVKRMMSDNTGKGKEILQQKLSDNITAFYSSLSETFDLNLDTGDLSATKEQLLEAAGNAEGIVAEFLLMLANQIDESTGTFFGSAGNQTFENVVASSLKSTTETKKAMNELDRLIIGESNRNYAGLLANSNVKWGALDQNIFYMLNSRAKGYDTFTDEMIDEAYANALLGRQASPENQQRILSDLFGGDLSAENMIATYQKWMNDQDTYAGELAAFRNLEDADKLTEAMSSQEGAVEKTTKALKDYNDQIGPKQIQYLNKYGDATASVADTVSNLSKSAKTSASALGSFTTNLNKLARYNTLIKGIKGKKGSDLSNEEISLFEQFGYDSKDIKAKTADELESIRNSIEDAINESWRDEVAAPIVELMNQLATTGDMPEEVQFHLSTLVKADGTWDVSAAAAYLEAQGNEAYNSLIAVLKAFDGAGGSLSVDLENGGFVLRATETGSSKTPRGGGGGGGKSAIDKMLERHKHELGQIQHRQKLLEIEEKEYDYYNQFNEQRSNVQAQIDVQGELYEQYKKNIAEMTQMLSTVSEGTDDWWKLKEAIDAAEEAMKSINSTINELNAKNIKILEDQQKLQDAPGTHVQTMLEKLASRATSEDRFNDYERLTQDRINEIQNQKSLNDVQIKEWEAELANYVENSDSWIEVRDKIWALEEENADLENQALEQTLELNQQRLSQIGKILQENTQTATHNQNIASAFGDYYQNGGYRRQYEDAIRAQQQSNAILIQQNRVAEQSALDQMATLQEGTTAWFEAQAAVYSYQEAIAQTEITQEQLNRTLTESNIEAVNEQYTDATRELLHVNDLLKNQAQEYLSTNDFDAYFEAMERYLDNLPDLIEESTTKLNGLQAIYDEGMANGTLDLTTQRSLLDAINEAESERQNLILEQAQAQRELNKTNLDIMFEQQSFKEGNYEHNLKLVGYESSKYQNAGELTNYGRMIEAENGLRKDRVEVLKEELAQLEAEHEKFKDGSDEEERIVDAIKKHEEAIASENTQIEKNNKLLDENQKKIIQVQKTLENAVDKEIEDQKRRQREILSANVSMQNTIVDLLRKSLQDQWNLRKKDLQQEKDSLNEYKKLINERFNYRKKAAQQADKDEELADYRRQLALLEADPTQTKAAKELRRKIEDLEKDKAWTIAEDELNAEVERTDQQLEGIDKFVQYNEELLNEILSDANNFADEMNNILSGSFEESYDKIIEFMQKENEAFMKSLPDAQKQMIQSWEDTWKKANDILDNNYSLISEYLYDENGNLRSEEEVVDWFKNNDRMYRDYMENGDTLNMRLLEIGWQESYRNVVAALKDDAIFIPDDHTLGDVVSKLDELKDNIFNVNIVDVYGNGMGMYGLDSSGIGYQDFSNGLGYNYNDYAGTGKIVVPEVESTTTTTSSGTGKTEQKTKYGYVFTDQYGIEHKSEKIYDTKEKAIEAGIGVQRSLFRMSTINDLSKSTDVKSYLHGGKVDYTGPAWVDGTKTRPEAFLDATDTENIRAMLDMFNYVKNSPYMSYVDPSMYGNNTNVGDVNITINQAELKSDADINKLAKQVGQAFTKELKINGISMTGYSFA